MNNETVKYIRVVRDENGNLVMVSDETTQELTSN
jgi:hypothetical protein